MPRPRPTDKGEKDNGGSSRWEPDPLELPVGAPGGGRDRMGPGRERPDDEGPQDSRSRVIVIDLA